MHPGNEGKDHGAEGRAPWRHRISSGARDAVRFLLDHSRSRACLVSNQTNHRLKIRRPDGAVLTLSPLECAKRVSPREVEAFGLRELEQRGTISLRPEPSQWAKRLALLQSLLSKLGLLAFVVGSYFLLGDKLERAKWCLLLSLVFLGLSLVSMLLVRRLGIKAGSRPSLGKWARGKFYGLLLLSIGFGIPGLVILASKGFLSNLHKVLVVLQAWVPSPGSEAVLPEVPADARLLIAGRLLQLLLIGLLSLLPALLFFAFDREHQGTLRERFIAHIFRFDPEVKSRQDVQARYGKQMDEAYGAEHRDGVVRLSPTRRSPLLVASLVLALGWTFTLLSTDQRLGSGSTLDFLAFFQPQKSTLPFGFLGAYAYTLTTTFRSYARRDLQPKIYSHITTRVFTVMVLAWVLDESWLMMGAQADKPALAAALHTLAFVVGIIPETGLVFIGELLHSTFRRLRRSAKAPGLQLVDPHEPLTSLEGIDLYDRARLQDEGVTNVQGLARHDVVELMIQTRIPAPRLLDWVDQAILHLHANAGGQVGGSPDPLLLNLRRYGIRTVTDLLEASEKAQNPEAHAELIKLLSGPESNGTIPRLQVVLDVIRDEEWVAQLLCWHKTQNVREEVVDVPVPRPEPKDNELKDTRALSSRARAEAGRGKAAA
ncbi:hypothetical protein ACLESO_08390 [Pyxidicoccus sp. 3LG]